MSPTEVQLAQSEGESPLPERLTAALPLLGAYLVGSWTFLQAVDWVLARVGASPHWATLLFVALLGMLPSLVVFLLARDRIARGGIRPWERYAFLANAAALAVVLLAAFGSTDLGATTTEVTFTDADGTEQSVTVAKAQYRRQVPVFPVVPADGGVPDSVDRWLGVAYADVMRLALQQNPFLSPSANLLEAGLRAQRPLSTTEELDAAAAFEGERYVDGTYRIEGERITLEPTVRAQASGQVLAKAAFSGLDPIALLDSAGDFALANLGLTKPQRARTRRLYYREAGTNNPQAMRQRYYGAVAAALNTGFHHLLQAIELDSTYAQALYATTELFNGYSLNPERQRQLISQAMRHRGRLAKRDQAKVMVMDCIVAEDWERAIKLMDVQRRVDANEPATYRQLAELQWKAGRYAEAAASYDSLALLSPLPADVITAGRLYLLAGTPELARQRVDDVLARDPENVKARVFALEIDLHEGDYARALAAAEELVILHPEYASNLRRVASAARYLAESGPLPDTDPLVGVYTTPEGIMKFSMREVNGFLLCAVSNQGPAFMYPLGDHMYAMAWHAGNRVMTAIPDAQGRIARIDWHEYKPSGVEVVYSVVRDDPNFDAARSALLAGDYADAAPRYAELAERHPLNPFFTQVLQHLTYREAVGAQAVAAQRARIAGTYGAYRFVERDGYLAAVTSTGEDRALALTDSTYTLALRGDLLFVFREREDGGREVEVFDQDFGTGQRVERKGRNGPSGERYARE